MLPAYFVGQIRQFGRPFLKNISEDAMIPNFLQYENCKFSEEELSRYRYGWPRLFSVFAPVGKARESAVSNCSGLNPKGPGLLL